MDKMPVSINRFFCLNKGALLLLAAFLLVSGCSRIKNAESTSIQNGPVVNQLAKRYSIERKSEGEWTLSVLDPWKNSGKTYRYRIVKGEKKSEAGSPDMPVIRIPVKKWIVTSTPHIAMMEALGALDHVVGFPDKKFIYSPKALAQGFAEVGGGEKRINIEKIVSLKPELCMADVVTEAGSLEYKRLEPYGIATVFDGDYLEETALARLEWIKVFGLLLDKEAEAKRYFEKVRSEYEGLRALAAKASSKPSVLCGLPYKGVWYVPGGKSYPAQFIADAGGSYVFAGVAERGGVPIAMEKIFAEARGADFWLNASDARSLDQIAGMDERFRSFSAFGKSRVYNGILRMNEKGGNDFYESGIVHPELILGDLCKILHPELFKDRTFFFYQALP